MAASFPLRDLRRHIIEALRAAGKETPELDARLLICHALQIDDTVYHTSPDLAVSASDKARLDALLQRRLAGEPVSRILGRRGFWNHDFRLSEDTLDPRPDSETLIETVLSLVDARGGRQRPWRLIDLGTGSGALLLSLLMELPQATGLGVDISAGALATAADNASAIGCDQRVAFRRTSWLEGIDERFDIVVCNPPYIPSTEIPALAPEVGRYDPLRALDGGEDGLAPYRVIMPQLPKVLHPGGFAVFEMGDGQHDELRAMAVATGLILQGKPDGLHADLSGRWRCLAVSARSGTT